MLLVMTLTPLGYPLANLSAQEKLVFYSNQC